MPDDTQLEFHLPAPPVSGDTALIPARMVNEFAYCPRLAYLMWTQGEWAETGDTVEGRRVHARVDKPNAPLPAPQALESDEAPEAGKTVSRSLTLSSTTLGVWTCPRLVESHCLLLCFVLELYGAFVAKGRMPADGVIKAIDISGDGIFGLAA